MVFGAVNILSTEDKRTLRGVDRLEYVLRTAQALFDWVQNGRVGNGSAVSDLMACDGCSGDVEENEAYDMMLDGKPSIVCKRCFEGAVEDSIEAAQYG